MSKTTKDIILGFFLYFAIGIIVVSKMYKYEILEVNRWGEDFEAVISVVLWPITVFVQAIIHLVLPS